MHIIPKVTKSAIAAVLGTAALLATTAAQAVPVISAVNISAPNTTAGVYINVLTGVSGLAAATPGWDINPWGSAGLGFFTPANITGGAYVMIPGSALQVANLPLGSVIGATSGFGSGSSTAVNATQWNLNSTNNYFGFRFVNEATSQVHYGFAQLSIGSTITSRSVIGIGYESVAGVPITVVPEPGTYALMGLGLAGLALAARRRKQD